ncbi:MAG: hypothetical protein E6Q92_12775 [Burkholderiaceae bacterium]|jgi:hypothetical protein|nr:MAG: hypothetical protein E6Q92_12775 [Burkholderiaceae bacterium]
MSQVLRQRVRSRARDAVAGGGLLLAVLLLAGCSAALDWRQIQPDGWSLVAALPCKPATQQRQVALAGQKVVMTMLACSADAHTFALASAELGDPAQVQPILLALGQAARMNLQGRVQAEQPANVPGMTPSPAALRWRLLGQLPSGQAAAEQVQVFAHGTRVFQAAVIGAQADDARTQPFFDALKVLP